MKRIIRLTESDLNRIVKRVIKEQSISSTVKNMFRDFMEGGDIDYNYIENSMTSKELADLMYASLNDNIFSDLDRGTETKTEYYYYQDKPKEIIKKTTQNPKEMPKDYSAADFNEWGNAEAPVEAAFLNMSKPLKKEGSCIECWKKFKEVSDQYKQRFNRDLMKDVKNQIDIYKKYHKKSIAAIISSWGTSPY